MDQPQLIRKHRFAATIFMLLMVTCVRAGSGAPVTNAVVVIDFQPQLEILRHGAQRRDPAHTNQTLDPGDQGWTDRNGRALLRLSDRSEKRIGPNSHFEIEPSPDPGQPFIFRLWKGVIYLFNREKTVRIKFRTSTALAAIQGTEFVLEVDEQGRTVLTVLDGIVELSNNRRESITLTNKSQGIVEPDGQIRKTAVIETVNLVQWCLYYPAVLDIDELELAPEEEQVLVESLAAYRRGNLLEALAKYPDKREPASPAEKVYRAALSLSVGQVEGASAFLESVAPAPSERNRSAALAIALRKLIAAVKYQPQPSTFALHVSTNLATVWLAESYYLQSQSKLKEALLAARRAVGISTNFAFGWARVAELEFSFGRISAARGALEKSLRLAPANAQALALKGFLLAAENKISEAVSWFEQAIAIDGALGNAWLGRGLCRIRQGQLEAGRDDLQNAAALEPNRSLLRSYLGKVWSEVGDYSLAIKELMLAKQLDSNDPTPWLYSALLNREENRINTSVSDLEESIERNDNRALYRSRLLLDEDRAVRSSSLARMYQDAGMNEVAIHEATRAVSYDYANYSAHQFMSESFNALRDPTRFNLRYETLWFNEWLLANLLSPVGGTSLSQHISQQEYSRLFERNRIGLSSSMEYRSDGQYRELASQFGVIGNTSWSLDLDYQHNNGVRPNNDLDRIEWYMTIKQQLTAQDSVMLLTKLQDYHSGDNLQYYNPTNSRSHFSFDEYQSPIILGGYHHEWLPGVHTLLLGGRLENDQHFSDRAANQLLLIPADPYDSDIVPFDVRYRGQLEIYTAELNQIFQWNRLTLSAGARYQSGTFDTTARLFNPAKLGGFFDGRATNDISSNDDFERLTGYGYLTVQALDSLWLTAGLAYDDISYPRNFRHPPISSGEDHRSQLGPKAAMVWNPTPQATVRGVFTRSLGGVSLDESYRLEPTQLAGFPQAFRSLISETVVGSVAGPEYQSFGLALDLKFSSRTYVGIQAERLETDVRRTVGVFAPVAVSGPGFIPPFIPASTVERLDYRENVLALSLNQLVGNTFVLGASYKYAEVELRDVLPEVPVSALPTADQTLGADLHQTSGYVLFNHPTGFFARAESHWYHQNNSGSLHPMPGDDFFQHNVFAGYRFARRRAEILLGILNLADQDYRLNPLTVYSELPRERTFIARLNFQF